MVINSSWGTRAMVINSPFIAFEARARILFATWLPGVNEWRMPLTKWLVVITCLLLCSPGAVALAGQEALCAALGSQCVCSEPFNTATHDGGNATWTTPGAFNPDDSTTKACYPFPTGDTEIYCSSPTFTPVAASTQSAFLPSGHSLSYLIKQVGRGTCHAGHPGFNEAPDMTYCIRAYSRWEVGSAMPSENPADQQQQKILTLGAIESGTTNGYLNIQISFGEGPPTLHTRFDGELFNAPNDFQTLGSVPGDCENNLCRFEACLDYSALGEGRARLRRTSVAPGSGQTTVFKPVGATLHPSGINMLGNGVTGLAMFAQLYDPIRYSTHFIVTKVRPENRNFWPGAACEVEGGCGSPPTSPQGPTGLIVK
jgi:hypothetical protein